MGGAFILLVTAGIYLSLAFLPPGRLALIGIAIAFAASQALWYINVPEGGGGPFAALITLAQIAMVMAAIAQGLRIVLGPDTPRWTYPLIVAAGLAGGLFLAAGAFGG